MTTLHVQTPNTLHVMLTLLIVIAADSGSSTKRKQRSHFGSLPHDIFGSPWTRSDSDPSLQDRYMNDRDTMDTNVSYI